MGNKSSFVERLLGSEGRSGVGRTQEPTRRTGELRGAIDDVQDALVLGWVSDATHRPVDLIDCTIDGVYVGSCTTFQPRDDLRELEIGSGDLGFCLPLPVAFEDGRPHTVRIHAFSRGRKLGELMLDVCIPAPALGRELARSHSPRETWRASYRPQTWNGDVVLSGVASGTELATGWYFHCTPGQEVTFAAEVSFHRGSTYDIGLALRHRPLHGCSRVTACCSREELLRQARVVVELDVTLPTETALGPRRCSVVVLGRSGRHATLLTKRAVIGLGPGRRRVSALLDDDRMRAIRANAVQFASIEIGLELQEPYELVLHGLHCMGGPTRTGDEGIGRFPRKDRFEARSLQEQFDSPALDRTMRPILRGDRPHRMDVVVPVFDAAESVSRCLSALTESNDGTYRVIVFDDGSGPRAARLVDGWARARADVDVVRHGRNRGYTKTVNQGIQLTKSPLVVFLNSDAVVPDGWQHRLLSVFDAHPGTGLVGPVSNAASWQSVPILFDDRGDWMVNGVPGGDLTRFQRWLEASWQPRHPVVPLLNGFCLGVRRQVFEDVGTFDENTFPVGYGEENDLCIRARKAGWDLRCADDLYVYHEKSRSFRGRRAELTSHGNAGLIRKHPDVNWDDFASQLSEHPDLRALRSEVAAAFSSGGRP